METALQNDDVLAMMYILSSLLLLMDAFSSRRKTSGIAFKWVPDF